MIRAPQILQLDVALGYFDIVWPKLWHKNGVIDCDCKNILQVGQKWSKGSEKPKLSAYFVLYTNKSNPGHKFSLLLVSSVSMLSYWKTETHKKIYQMKFAALHLTGNFPGINIQSTKKWYFFATINFCTVIILQIMSLSYSLWSFPNMDGIYIFQCKKINYWLIDC